MKFRTIFLTSLMLMVIFSCNLQKRISHDLRITTTELNEKEQRQLDSILQRGLDHEALYTIIGKIKPMSSVASFSFPIANADSLKRTKGDVLDLNTKQKYLDKIAQVQTQINTLSYPDLKFVLVPYKNANKEKRILQLSAVRVSLLDSLLRKEASFFGQFGLVPGADPATVVSVIEGCDKYERWRAYGYLFGYPEYAIDFFVHSFVMKEQTKKNLERNFFQIPSYSKAKGAFVYAYPKNHTPDKVDSTLYFRAREVLDQYKELRGNYLKPDSTLQTTKLLNDFFRIRKQTK